ncbi:MAG TPA: hypothetical protein VM285_01325 [Polyangia bacterium]|nr:hypothetical protein [Polyangia bacterium]
MLRRGILPAVVLWLRMYAVALLLIGALLAALIQVYAFGTPPAPQQPPEGYFVEQDKVSLEWNTGTRQEPVTLQVAIDDPGFTEPVLERQITGSSHTLSRLQSGGTYYWRLVQDGEAGPTASFRVSKYNVDI